MYSQCLMYFLGREKPESYSPHLSKRENIEYYQTLKLDFGRCSGKTSFAVNLLLDHPRTVIISKSLSMARSTGRLYHELRGDTVNVPGLETTFLSASLLNEGELMRRRSQPGRIISARERIVSAEFIVIDEAALTAESMYELTSIVPNDCTLIFLGDAHVSK